MEIRVLKYFLAVAQEGSITGAANFLHLTQPTLTRQLKDLEKELGHQLFIRTNHNVSLTSEGIVFRKRAQEIIDMVEKTQAEFNSMNNDISGDIYIGAGETAAITGIAKIIKELQEEHKNIKFHLYSGNAEDITERLDKGLLDFGILIQPTDIS
ncbi:MAG: LysR family transcriptional regulator, partial [Candidatus Gastranaerophilaceae bacterium]